jgi:hypothetical protein
MTVLPVDRLYGRTISLDVCQTCQVIWFDQGELLQMAPGATVKLVSLFVKDQTPARVPLGQSLNCPRCRRRLEDVQDMVRATRFTYARCPDEHGRLLTFYQFLRARSFVRTLGAAEIDELRQHIRQINCANCGAPIDIGKDAACSSCRTPVAVLDPAQLSKAVDELRRSLEPKAIDPTLPMQMAIERMKTERVFAAVEGNARPPSVLDLFFGNVTDPIAGGLQALRQLLE